MLLGAHRPLKGQTQSPAILTCSPSECEEGAEMRVTRSYYSICCHGVLPINLDFLLWKLWGSLGCLIRCRFLGFPPERGNLSL